MAKVLAIGDGDNDVELLEQASISLAVARATDRAKAASDIVLPDGIDGWARLLEYL